MSAFADDSFSGAGKTVGMELWRIENKVPMKFDKVRLPFLFDIGWPPMSLVLFESRLHYFTHTLPSSTYSNKHEGPQPLLLFPMTLCFQLTVCLLNPGMPVTLTVRHCLSTCTPTNPNHPSLDLQPRTKHTPQLLSIPCYPFYPVKRYRFFQSTLASNSNPPPHRSTESFTSVTPIFS